eukprot:jgi/Mesen1/4364/ME000022S03647
MAWSKAWTSAGTGIAAVAAMAGAIAAAVHATGGDYMLRPMPRSQPAICTCDDEFYALDEGLARCQLASDFLIALAYFSIPMELLYFFTRAKIFPFRWVLVQFGLFIILCGFTHLVQIWTYGPHSYATALSQTLLKVSTALVSCATAFLLIKIIPALLNIKVRELFLQHKAAQLDREVGVIRHQEEVARHVRMLTHEIRSTLDRHTILNTTLVELFRTLNLDNCTIWMPSANGAALELTHELERRLVQVPVTVSSMDPIVQSIVRSDRAVQIPATCAIGRASAPRGCTTCSMAAIRVPLLPVCESNRASYEGYETTFAIMVLVLPGGNTLRQWQAHEVQMVEVVADQVAVALSHAAVLEESQRTRSNMVEQNRALQLARQKAETAVRARNDFLAVMNHEMRTPLHSVIALSSILQEAGIAEDQAPMVDTILKSSSLLSSLINDVLEFSRLEEGSLQLDMRPFELRDLFQEAGKLAWPMVRSKGLEFTLELADDLPAWVVGDDKRLLQTTLNLVGNAVKSTAQGSVSLRVSLEGDSRPRDPRQPDWRPLSADRHVYIRVEVKDSGRGVAADKIEQQFQQFGIGKEGDDHVVRSYGGTGLGLAICQKFVELMYGHMWIESKGLNQGSTVTCVVRIQLDLLMRHRGGDDPLVDLLSRELSGLKVLVVDDNNANKLATQLMLDMLECDVTAVDSAVECLSVLSRKGSKLYDAILLDICMPEMDGFGVARRIQQIFRPDDQPLLVALTARTDKGMQGSCLDAGFDAVLLKPIAVREIGTTLCELVRANGIRPRSSPPR